MQPLEILASLVLLTGLALAAQRAGGERAATAQVRHDVEAVAAIGVAYRGHACAAAGWSADARDMARRLKAAGIPVTAPPAAAGWRVRYAGGRTAGSHGAPLRTAGMVVEVERENATVVQRRAMRALGGRAEGTSMVLAVAAAGGAAQRARRAFLARRGDAGC